MKFCLVVAEYTAVAERRRQQEEEERLKRETEEEWLKTAQKKRKYLRDQWLRATTPAPVLLTLHNFRSSPPPHDEADKHTAAQKTPKEKEGDAADARKEERAVREENRESVSCTTAALIHNHRQAATTEDAQANIEDHFSVKMEQNVSHENGQEGRSVLGMLAVQVERDPKTGATVVTSVAPMATPADHPNATTVFDDGRKSIHAVGGTGCQPSTEELGQILSAIDGVGMKALLDEVTVVPNEAETKTEHVEASRTPKEKVVSFPTHHALSRDNDMQLDSTQGYDLEARMSIEHCAVRHEEDKQEERRVTALRDIEGAVETIEDQQLEEGPVTLLFLGYADATTSLGESQEDGEGMLTVERVIITEDGEEHVIGPDTSALCKEAAQEARKESQAAVFRDIPPEGNGAGGKVQEQEGDKEQHNSSPPTRASGEESSKHKTCQCCSVM
ncbi:paralemmin-1-like [Echeneis naucrates]|uniref:paralemmin-1-like n=1 Tax=Echeneis naucrates TaxID=173247 RepID=UPI001113A09C|nr:paralemmin-1-like [Echeneis naucrates]